MRSRRPRRAWRWSWWTTARLRRSQRRRTNGRAWYGASKAASGGGFDPARDIEAVTINRWAHGYAYEYGRPWDKFWPDGPLPSHIARRPFGRIAIANSDSAPRAYADTAIDMAYRAVRELKGRSGGEVARGVDGVLPAGVRG